MAFSSTTPTAPWTTGIAGSGTWAQLVTFINNPAIISQVGDTYIVTGLIDIKAIMSALLNSVIINRTGGGWSIGVGGSVTLGRSITTPSGQAMAVDGCTVIDDVDCYQRGVDNYLNTKCWVRNSGYLNMYGSVYINKNAQTVTANRSDLDFQSGSFVKLRDVRFHVDGGADQYDHYAGSIDIDGLVSTHASDTAGSILELMTTSVITKLNNMTPYLNNATSRQCTLWIKNVTLSQWGGDNFAPWDLSGYYRFDDPKVTGLIFVDRYGTGTASQCERRTTEFLCLDTVGAVAATVSVFNNVDELDGEGVASGTTGIYTAKLKRKVFPGGTSATPSGYTRTPHVIFARKWGYKTYSTAFQANPTSFGQTKLTSIVAMVPDTNITLSSAASAAISGVTIIKHGHSVNWNSKDFSITVQANSSLTLSQVYHSVAYQCSEANVLLPRAAARVTASGHQYQAPWTGAVGDTDLTLVIVHTTRIGDTVFASQIAGSIGTATAGLSCRTHVNRGVVFQNFTNDLFPDGSYTAAQAQYNNPDGGEQLLISIGRYDSVAKSVNVWTNNKNYASETQTIDRGTGSQFFRVLGQGNTMSWEVENHTMCETMGFNRRLSDTEVSDLSKYLANKWHHTAVGNITPTNTNSITATNFPVTGANDWTPLDYASGQGPNHWVSMCDPTDYVLSGSNITSFKDKVTGLQITNAGYSSAVVVNNFRKFVAHQLFDASDSTARAVYPDGRYRGVRVIDENGNPFPGVTQMMADDGTYYVSPTFATINGLAIGTEVRVYKVSDDSEMAGIEATAGTFFTFSYSYVADIPVYIVVFALDKLPIRFTLTLGATNSTIPIQQIIDRVYNNQ
jgi:hypothetical protein